MSNYENNNIKRNSLKEFICKYILFNNSKYSIIFAIIPLVVAYIIFGLMNKKNVDAFKTSASSEHSQPQFQKSRRRKNKKKKNKPPRNYLSSFQNKNSSDENNKENNENGEKKSDNITCWNRLKSLICYYCNKKKINNINVINNGLNNIKIKDIQKNILEEIKKEGKDEISFKSGLSLEKNKDKIDLKIGNKNKSEKNDKLKMDSQVVHIDFEKNNNIFSEYNKIVKEIKNKEFKLGNVKMIEEDLKNKNELLNKMVNILLILVTNIKSLEIEINDKKSNENISYMKNKIKTNIIKMSNIFRFLNNCRLILVSRKYVNKIIQNEVKNNEKMQISKSVFLNDWAGFNYINDEKKLKLYVSQFIVQIGDWKLPQKTYNLVLDFLYYLKNYLNDSVHFVNPSEEVTTSKKFHSIFYNKNKNENEINNNSNFEEIKSIKDENLEITYENEIMITNKVFLYGQNTIKDIQPNNKDITLEDLKLVCKNVLSLNKVIDNLNMTVSKNQLESHLIEEYKNNGLEEENNFNYTFSLHDLEDDSINNFKNIFVNFFFRDENRNINKTWINILEKEKRKVRNNYLQLINIMMSSENIINNINEFYEFKGNKNVEELFEDLRMNKRIIKDQILNIKKWINNLQAKFFEYYDLLLLSILFKIKVKQLEEKLLKDENILSFEKIFKEWKMSFDEDYIQKLKRKYSNNIQFNYIEVPENFRFNNKKIEYLKSSKLYRKFIDELELSNMNSKLMMNLIDNIIKGENIDIKSTDEEINYTTIKKLNEDKYLEE